MPLSNLNRAELNAGLFAASLPPLKSTFEKILRKLGVMTGLSTPGNTYPNSSYGGRYKSRTFSSKLRASLGYTLNDEESQARSAYPMENMDRSRSQPDRDGVSLEEDQKHILSPGGPGQGEWITKTTEYSVSHEIASSAGERQQDDHV